MRREKFPTRLTAAAMTAAIGLASSAGITRADGAAPDKAAPSADDTPRLAPAARILPIQKVRVGMKGYGMTVFQGTRIEPFPLEVVSVIRNYYFGFGDAGPKRSAIWIRCTGPRMQRSGAVQGMSGSPIYVWDEGEPQVLGRGGRLIGAFAFGFDMAKDCYVGVEPIEQMRHMRRKMPPASAMAGGTARPMLAQLVRMAKATSRHDAQWRLQAMHDLFERLEQRSPAVRPHEPFELPPPPTAHRDGRTVPMMLPVAFGRSETAEAVAPLLRTYGLSAVSSTAGSQRAAAPAWIDPDRVRLQAGSVFSIPMVYGDLDIAASGTVTDVLPDGTVLGIGHPLDVWAESALPLATGYVDFVLPSISTSFKLGGSLRHKGAVVNCENSGAVGLMQSHHPDAKFESSPVEVTINWPDGLAPEEEAARRFNYQVIRHRGLSPVFAAIAAASSLTSERSLPIDNTIHSRTALKFVGRDEPLEIDGLYPQGNMLALVYGLMPAIAAMANNPFEIVHLEHMKMDVDVETVVRSGLITHGRIDHDEIAPGEELGITVRIRKYGGEVFEKRIDLEIPHTVAEGKYEILVGDGSTYLNRLLSNRPHLTSAGDIDELYRAVELLTTVRGDRIYVMMNLPHPGLAVGQQEMLRLPTSRLALMATPTSTMATPFRDWIAKKVPMDIVVNGGLKFNIAVTKSKRTSE